MTTTLNIDAREKPEYISAKSEILNEYLWDGGSHGSPDGEKVNWLYQKCAELLIEVKRLREVLDLLRERKSDAK